MREDEAEKSGAPKQELQANGLGVLFVAAGLGLALVLSMVALLAYVALSPAADPAPGRRLPSAAPKG